MGARQKNWPAVIEIAVKDTLIISKEREKNILGKATGSLLRMRNGDWYERSPIRTKSESQRRYGLKRCWERVKTTRC